MEFSLMTETSPKACAVKGAVKAVVLLEFSSASLLNTQEKCSYTNPPPSQPSPEHGLIFQWKPLYSYLRIFARVKY